MRSHFQASGYKNIQMKINQKAAEGRVEDNSGQDERPDLIAALSRKITAVNKLTQPERLSEKSYRQTVGYTKTLWGDHMSQEKLRLPELLHMERLLILKIWNGVCFRKL
ncbi:hypothetical protein Baya_13296 [Bagarius yarrelli]|uniref:Uncharacterized protein n=1 Tax=Bagarius yarrelli TaxID=175774 RepID=A0A556V5I6_BAGYA|nr:hypothetical protein Baya_13296 [Bagarius yarrelli]